MTLMKKGNASMKYQFGEIEKKWQKKWEFCEQQFVSKGMIADFAIHDPHPPICAPVRIF